MYQRYMLQRVLVISIVQVAFNAYVIVGNRPPENVHMRNFLMKAQSWSIEQIPKQSLLTMKSQRVALVFVMNDFYKT